MNAAMIAGVSVLYRHMAQLNKSISEYLVSRHGSDKQPWIIILEFSLVLGIDSSAAQAQEKWNVNQLEKLCSCSKQDVCSF